MRLGRWSFVAPLGLASSTFASACTPAATAGPALDPLIGDWVGPELSSTWKSASDDGSPRRACPREVELFADGTMEANWINDDSAAAMCSFALLQWSVDRTKKPPLLVFGVDASASAAVPFALDADTLHLEPVEGHRDTAMDAPLRRAPEAPAWSHELLVGSFQTDAFWGLPSTLTIAADGSYTLADAGEAAPHVGRIVVHDEHTLDEQGEGVAMLRCLYRVSTRRLTISCTHGDSYPRAFVAADTGALKTSVLTRLP